MCEWMDLLRQFNFLTVLLRLFLAFLFGGCVGMERERRAFGHIFWSAWVPA